jgi:pimeloyl-ACP methyl ester carboxylesterase
MEQKENKKGKPLRTEFPKCSEISKRIKNWKYAINTNEVNLYSKIIEKDDQKEYETQFDCVILHGLFANGNHFKTIAEDIIKKNRRVKRICLVDLRNHGASDHHESMTYNEMMEDLNRHLVSLSINDFFLIVHSMGAKTAMYYCQKYGSKVQGIVIIDTYPKDYSNMPETYLNQQKLIEFLLLIDLDLFNKNSLIEYLSSQIVKNLLLFRVGCKQISWLGI